MSGCASSRVAAPASRSVWTGPWHAAGGDDLYLSELRRHSIESVEREVRWLTDLINAERNSDTTRGQSATPPRSAPAPTPVADTQ